METRNQKHRPTRDNAYRQDMVSFHREWSYYYLNSIPYEIFGTTLRPISYDLENFHRKFANLVAPPSNGNENFSERAITYEKPLKIALKSTHKP